MNLFGLEQFKRQQAQIFQEFLLYKRLEHSMAIRIAWVLGIHLFFAMKCCNASEGWIALVTAGVTPNATATLASEGLCLSVLGQVKIGAKVYLSHCSDIRSTKYKQLWRYENHMLSVPVTSTEDRLCMAGSLQNNSVFLDECKQGESSQNWVLNDVNYTIRNEHLLYLKYLNAPEDRLNAALQVSKVSGSAFRMLYSSRINAVGTRSVLKNSYIVVDLVNILGRGCPSAGIDLRGSGSLSSRVLAVGGESYVLTFQHGGTLVVIDSSCTRPSTGTVQVPMLKSPINFTSSTDGSCKEEKVFFNATSTGNIVIKFTGTNRDPGCGPVISKIWVKPLESPRKSAIASAAEKRIAAAAAVVIVVLVMGFLVYIVCRRHHKTKQIELSIRRYSLREIKVMTGDFSKRIGEGSYGSVFLASSDGTHYAVKALQKWSIVDFESELRMLERVHHRCVVDCHGYCTDEGEFVYLVLEYMAGGSLYDQLHERPDQVLEWDKRVRIAKDIAFGVCYLHHGIKSPIIHRDVKPANVLLNLDFSAKLADFGASRVGRTSTVGTDVVTTNAEFRGTPGYADPEALRLGVVSGKTDVYSYGVTLLELISGQHMPREIVEWARHASLEEIADASLGGSYNLHELQALYDIALMCVDKHDSRPKMSEIWDIVKNLEAGSGQAAAAIQENSSANHLRKREYATRIRLSYSS